MDGQGVAPNAVIVLFLLHRVVGIILKKLIVSVKSVGSMHVDYKFQ
jgi:hypothetical protein